MNISNNNASHNIEDRSERDMTLIKLSTGVMQKWRLQRVIKIANDILEDIELDDNLLKVFADTVIKFGTTKDIYNLGTILIDTGFEVNSFARALQKNAEDSGEYGSIIHFKNTYLKSSTNGKIAEKFDVDNIENRKLDKIFGIVGDVLEKSKTDESWLNWAIDIVLRYGNDRDIFNTGVLLRDSQMDTSKIEAKLRAYAEKKQDYTSVINFAKKSTNLRANEELGRYLIERSQIDKKSTAKLDGLEKRYVLSFIMNVPVKNINYYINDIVENGRPVNWVFLAKFIPEANIETLRTKVLKSQSPEANYRMACYVKRQFISKEQNLDGRNNENETNLIYSYYKAKYGEDSPELLELSNEHALAVLDSKSYRFCYKIIKNLEDIDTEPFEYVILNSDTNVITQDSEGNPVMKYIIKCLCELDLIHDAEFKEKLITEGKQRDIDDYNTLKANQMNSENSCIGMQNYAR